MGKDQAVKPNLFIVGAAKCGTTSLVNTLSSHDDIYFPVQKEPMYYIDDIGIREKSEYLQLYRGREEVIIGDGSTGYLYPDYCAARIKEHCPEAKILIVLRHPARAAFSMWQYLLNHGNETQTFQQALEESETRKRADFKAACTGWYANYLYVDRYKYAGQVERYLDAFGREKVKVIVFEELIRDPGKILSDLWGYLGLKPMDAKLERENVSGRPRSRALKAILDQRKRAVRHIVPKRFRAPLRNALARVNTSSEKIVMSAAEYDHFCELADLEHEIAKLETLIERKLNAWR